MFFAMQPKHAVLGDLNRHLMSFYRCVRSDPRKVHAHALAAVDQGDYYKQREVFNSEADRIRRAGLFLYLNSACFNGLYRENRQGKFNVPVGARTSDVPTLSQLLEVRKALCSAELLNGDFSRTLVDVGDNDFVYADPPYFLSGKSYGEYVRNSFTLTDLDRFACEMNRVRAVGASVLISLPDSPTVRAMFKGWRIDSQPAQYQIAGNGSRSVSAKEAVIYSW